MGRRTKEQEDALRGAVKEDIARGELSIRKLARKHHCSTTTVKSIKANPVPQTGGPFEGGGPFEMAQGSLSVRPAANGPLPARNGPPPAQIALDTVAQRVAVHNRLRAVQDQVVVHIENGIINIDDVKLLLALCTSILKALEDIDKAKVIAANFAGAGAQVTPEQLRAEVRAVLTRFIERLPLEWRDAALKIFMEVP